MNELYISVDVEADGPVPGIYSMIALGAVVVEPSLNRTFYTTLKPITPYYKEENLRACGFTRMETFSFAVAEEAVKSFSAWLKGLKAKRLIFVSDNPGFDFAFVSYYMAEVLLAIASELGIKLF